MLWLRDIKELTLYFRSIGYPLICAVSLLILSWVEFKVYYWAIRVLNVCLKEEAADYTEYLRFFLTATKANLDIRLERFGLYTAYPLLKSLLWWRRSASFIGYLKENQVDKLSKISIAFFGGTPQLRHLEKLFSIRYSRGSGMGPLDRCVYCLFSSSHRFNQRGGN